MEKRNTAEELENELNELMLKLDYFEEQKKNITAMIEVTGRKIVAFNKNKSDGKRKD